MVWRDRRSKRVRSRLQNLPQPAALLPTMGESLLWTIPWFHHILLMEKFKDLPTSIWYMRQILQQGWSRNTLSLMISNQLHLRQGKAVNNFQERLPAAQS